MTYVLSDPHGNYQKYDAMLRAIHLRPTDTLYVLGDVIDRGPDGIRILLDMMARPNVVPILGNHEFTAAMCLPWLMEEVTDQSLDRLGTDQIAALSEWIANGGGPTLRSLKQLAQEDREDILDYLRDLNRFEPGKSLESYELTDFLFGSPDLDRPCFQDRFLVFGHTPVQLLREQAGEPPSDAIFRRGNLIGIDCGCGFDGPLGCLCLETLEEFYT